MTHDEVKRAVMLVAAFEDWSNVNSPLAAANAKAVAIEVRDGSDEYGGQTLGQIFVDAITGRMILNAAREIIARELDKLGVTP